MVWQHISSGGAYYGNEIRNNEQRATEEVFRPEVDKTSDGMLIYL